MSAKKIQLVESNQPAADIAEIEESDFSAVHQQLKEENGVNNLAEPTKIVDKVVETILASATAVYGKQQQEYIHPATATTKMICGTEQTQQKHIAATLTKSATTEESFSQNANNSNALILKLSPIKTIVEFNEGNIGESVKDEQDLNKTLEEVIKIFENLSVEDVNDDDDMPDICYVNGEIVNENVNEGHASTTAAPESMQFGLEQNDSWIFFANTSTRTGENEQGNVDNTSKEFYEHSNLVEPCNVPTVEIQEPIILYQAKPFVRPLQVPQFEQQSIVTAATELNSTNVQTQLENVDMLIADLPQETDIPCNAAASVVVEFAAQSNEKKAALPEYMNYEEKVKKVAHLQQILKGEHEDAMILQQDISLYMNNDSSTEYFSEGDNE